MAEEFLPSHLRVRWGSWYRAHGLTMPVLLTDEQLLVRFFEEECQNKTSRLRSFDVTARDLEDNLPAMFLIGKLSIPE
jgi:hypothetical protein